MTRTANAWKVDVQYVQMEAGPHGLIVSLTVTGPEVVEYTGCEAPYSAWIDSANGKVIKVATSPETRQVCAPHQVVIPVGTTKEFHTVISDPIPHGTYTVHGLLVVEGNSASENLPVVSYTV